MWRWATGPEAGTLFWTGAANGVASGFTDWGSLQPNDGNQGQDYLTFMNSGPGFGWADGADTQHGYIRSGRVHPSGRLRRHRDRHASGAAASQRHRPRQQRATVISVQDAINGTVSLDAVNELITFVPTANYFGTASYTYTIQDTSGATSTATVSFNIQAVNNDDPVITSAAAVNVSENTTAVITVQAADPDGTAVTYSIVGGADDVKFAIDPTTVF